MADKIKWVQINDVDPNSEPLESRFYIPMNSDGKDGSVIIVIDATFNHGYARFTACIAQIQNGCEFDWVVFNNNHTMYKDGEFDWIESEKDEMYEIAKKTCF
ncbi:MAG: hypothetical protein DRP09_10235 [Candidatus Thorarchaeota archaeon]|nr:MAG: hypothetical protein DRP09_10235 [Candidatus Thorarchaeota archaeon]